MIPNMSLKTISWATVLIGVFGSLLAVSSLAWLAMSFLDLVQGTEKSRFTPEVASALAAVSAIVIGIRQWVADRQYQRSQFYLNSALSGFEKADEMLSDGNNDRATWIGASRVLERSRRLSERISVPEHLDQLEIEMDYQRKRFYSFLGYSASFYYGIPDSNMSLDDAARLSSVPDERSTSNNKQIPEDAIYTVFNFLKYPEDYEDPKGGEFSEKDLIFLGPRGFRGLHDYIEHTRKFRTARGNLFSKTPRS